MVNRPAAAHQSELSRLWITTVSFGRFTRRKAIVAVPARSWRDIGGRSAQPPPFRPDPVRGIHYTRLVNPPKVRTHKFP